MRIERRKNGGTRAGQIREELGDILRSDSNGTPVCAPNCPNASPGRCSRHCPDIPRILSSDPEKHPLEGRIAPLVYELKRLEVFHPCWSCEGHNGPDGKLWKVPRVWFYCESVVHLRVLTGAVKELHLAEKLGVPWRVVVTFSDDDNADTTFSLEPNLDHERPLLPALQRDMDTIAEHLREVAFAEALKLSRLSRQMAIGLDSTALAALCQDPRTPVEGRLNGTTYTARIAIPDYGAHIERHYDRHTFTPPHGRFLLRR